jgi:RHS repeat-associated protein
MKRFINNIPKALLAIALSAMGPMALAQTATPEQKAGGKVVTPGVILESSERRTDNGSVSPDTLIIPIGDNIGAYSISGPKKVERNSQQTYTLVPWAKQRFYWYVNNGSVVNFFDDQCTIRFNTPASTATIYVFDANDRQMASLTVTVFGDPNPFSAGAILTGSQSVRLGEVPGDLHTSTPAGGSCNGLYFYQWQYSFNNIRFFDIDSSHAQDFSFEGPLDSTMYFRRRVVCANDTLYTGGVAVFVVPPLNGGAITTAFQSVAQGAVPEAIHATEAQNGNCTAYLYQWQQSADGYVYADVSGGTGQQLVFSAGADSTRYYRRRVICGADTAFTDIATIRVKLQGVASPPVTANTIDSLLQSAGVDIYRLFNIAGDSTANNRLPQYGQLAAMDSLYADKQFAATATNGYGQLAPGAAGLLANAPMYDNIDSLLARSGEGGPGGDTPAVPIPFIDDNTIQLYRSTGNYHALDSLTSLVPTVSFEEASVRPEQDITQITTQTTDTQVLRTYNTLGMTGSIAINGPSFVVVGITVRYTASFAFPPGSPPDIRWAVGGGTIVSQNIDPTNGPIYVDVNWTSPVGLPYVAVFDMASNQYGILQVYFGQQPCTVYPPLQTLYYGQTPNNLTVGVCHPTGAATVQYQWQVLDVYAPGNWTDIAGATGITYQPPTLDNAWLMYRRVNKGFDLSGNLVSVSVSSAASVKLVPLSPGSYQVAATHVAYNTVPTYTPVAQPGGGLLAPGAAYSHIWEASENGGPWQSIGTGSAFPQYAIRHPNTKVRWAVQITGLTAAQYALHQQYWKAYGPETYFSYHYQTAHYENRNYIRENLVMVKGVATWEDADLLAAGNKAQTTTYLDGLGRPEQLVANAVHYDEQASQWHDMVQPIVYGPGGRVEKSLLPYPTTDNIGMFKTNAATAQPAYYLAKFGDNTAYGKMEYDNSPLDRVVKAYAPGDGWAGSNIKVAGEPLPYNAAEGVRQFLIGYATGDRPYSPGVYPSLMLQKTVGTDEKGKKVITYADRAGQVVLKKVQLVDDGPSLGVGHNGWICTYYVYDDFGQLRYTIPLRDDVEKNLLANNWVITQVVADEACFWSEYDELGRVIAKKVPGKAVEYIAYDRRNRPVFTQDGNLQAGAVGMQGFIVTLYDELNRPVANGLLKGNQTIDDVRAWAAIAPDVVQILATPDGGTVAIHGNPLPLSILNNPAAFEQVSFTYYDGYGYAGAKTYDAAHAANLAYKNANGNGNVEAPVLTQRTAGMVTGTKVKVMAAGGAAQLLVTSVFYDEEGRSIQQQQENIKGGTELASTQYHFDGRAMSSLQTHNANGTAYINLGILTKYKFDRAGRLAGIAKKINDNTRNYLTSSLPGILEDGDAGYKATATYRYNELGQRAKKVLAPGWANGQGMETLEYTYNIRGWLTGINKDYALGEYASNQWEHFFGLYLGYDNRDGKFAAAQYNGSLTGVQWKSQGDNTPRRFDYEYDHAGRLKAARFAQRGSSSEAWGNAKVDFSTKDIRYDETGNLIGLTNMGVLPGVATPVMLDKLLYMYQPLGNKLFGVLDQGTAGAANGQQGDFKDGTNTINTPDYAYDANGNLTADNNRRIGNIRYNYLDKPVQIDVMAAGGGMAGTIEYLYDAVGTKLQKTVTEASANNGPTRKTVTTYIGAFTYEAITVGGTAMPETLQQIAHEEGRIRVVTPYSNPADPANFIGGGMALPGGQQGIFDYFIKDNLGNVRATITEEVNKAAAVCTMEDAVSAVAQQEQAQFGNPGSGNEVSATRADRPTAWTSGTHPPQTLNDNRRVSKLVAQGGTVAIGPNSLLRVMAGDRISAKADYYYAADPGNGAGGGGLNAMVQGLMGALGGQAGGGLLHGQAAQVGSSLTGSVPLQSFFNNQPPPANTNAPRAYLNWIFLDEQFNFVASASGSLRVQQSGNGATALAITGARATKNGYVYVYVSNESSEPVYFDNFAVAHEQGRLLGEDHYYAFGLKIAAISSKAVSSSLNVKMVSYGYQGSFSEEVTELGLNYQEFELRTYDPQIGRWTTPDPYNEFASPYVGMGNDPANNVDPTGGFVDPSGIIRTIAGSIKVTITGGEIGFISSAISVGTSTLSTALTVAASTVAVFCGTFVSGVANTNIQFNPAQANIGRLIIRPEVANDIGFSNAIEYLNKSKSFIDFVNLFTSGQLGFTDLVFEVGKFPKEKSGESGIYMYNNSSESTDTDDNVTYDFEPYVDVLTPEADGFNSKVHLQIKVTLNINAIDRSVGADAETIIHELFVHCKAWIERIKQLRSGAPIEKVKKDWAAAYKSKKDGTTNGLEQHRLLNKPGSKLRKIFDAIVKEIKQIFKGTKHLKDFSDEVIQDLNLNKQYGL